MKKTEVNSLRKRIIYILSAVTALAVIAAVTVLLLTREKSFEYSPEKCAVLLYHEIGDDATTENEYLFIRPQDFEAQMNVIYQRGVRTVFANEINGAENAVCITFDDGYESFYTEAFPILKKYNLKATVFIVSDTVQTSRHLTFPQIAEMAESGLVRFESHTKSHADLTLSDNNSLKDELYYSRGFIDRVTGYSPVCLAYPYGKYNRSVVRLTLGCGYALAFTTEFPTYDGRTYPPSEIPRTSIFRDSGTQPITAVLDALDS